MYGAAVVRFPFRNAPSLSELETAAGKSVVKFARAEYIRHFHREVRDRPLAAFERAEKLLHHILRSSKSDNGVFRLPVVVFDMAIAPWFPRARFCFVPGGFERRFLEQLARAAAMRMREYLIQRYRAARRRTTPALTPIYLVVPDEIKLIYDPRWQEKPLKEEESRQNETATGKGAATEAGANRGPHTTTEGLIQQNTLNFSRAF
ncbi:hypothetical protein [Thermosulfurimonas sp. F29]|uniref:hypothetical protein n=1 Tax=Thermosulfurimonas sp. F29 TaxID=2867247 RepID=UPI001C83790B|nr:hypothetical protein [Thermosulfurimonas sp. F29]MBX6424099.1 hypothetical protein [Thermosulfurimonas sp. F29]